MQNMPNLIQIHLKIFSENHFTKSNQTWLEWALNSPLSKMCLAPPISINDDHWY